jgi:hypothetical protein
MANLSARKNAMPPPSSSQARARYKNGIFNAEGTTVAAVRVGYGRKKNRSAVSGSCRSSTSYFEAATM